MRKSISLLLALALSGLFAAALTVSASAGSLDPQAVTIEVFKFKDGKLTGKVSADRRLCLNGRSVTILKDLGDRNSQVTTAPLNFSTWSDSATASFSKRHPAMDIDKRRARIRALKGDYIAKLAPTPVLAYGKTFTCLGDTVRTTISF